jgi:hypothetical protein
MVDKEPFESLTGIEQEVQITERTKHAMEDYFRWLQNAMSASPLSNVDLNKTLLSYAMENVTTAVDLVQKLSQARNLEDVVKIQTEFMSKQMDSLTRDKSHGRDLYQSGTRDEALYLIGNVGIMNHKLRAQDAGTADTIAIPMASFAVTRLVSAVVQIGA